MPEVSFGQKLSVWRKAEGLRQADLALRLGVSQQAVSYWERGKDLPDRDRSDKIRAMMAASNLVASETAFIKNQNSIRSLIDVNSVKLVGSSQGFKSIWPDFAQLHGVSLGDKLVGEIGAVSHSSEMRSAIFSGEIAAMSGVSVRHIDIELDDCMKHRWFVRFRRFGTMLLGDMSFETCDVNEAIGIEEIVRPDELV